jgi:hypothetical protein
MKKLEVEKLEKDFLTKYEPITLVGDSVSISGYMPIDEDEDEDEFEFENCTDCSQCMYRDEYGTC